MHFGVPSDHSATKLTLKFDIKQTHIPKNAE